MAKLAKKRKPGEAPETTNPPETQSFSDEPRRETKSPKWLFKEEPDAYNITELQKDGQTIWDGVKNNAALKNLREVKQGDRVLYYHTGKEKAIVGEMIVVRGPFPDLEAANEKIVVVEVQFQELWTSPLTLKRLKQEESLSNWELVKQGRLSVVPVSSEQWEVIERIRQSSE